MLPAPVLVIGLGLFGATVAMGLSHWIWGGLPIEPIPIYIWGFIWGVVFAMIVERVIV
jgi:hypothetical protein